MIKELLAAIPPVGVLDLESRLRAPYCSKSREGVQRGSHGFENEKLKTSLVELADIRKALRKRRRSIGRARYDLWPLLSPAFERIRDYVVRENIRKSGVILDLSDSLHNRPYAEYSVNLKGGSLASYICSFSSEGIHSGQLGLELLSPSNQILAHVVLQLATLNLHLPVTFPLEGVEVAEGRYCLRLFAKSEWPVYSIEFGRYLRFGLSRVPIAPFAEPIYCDG